MQQLIIFLRKYHRIKKNTKSIRRDLPLDALRAFAIFLYFSAHVLWLFTNSTEPWYPEKINFLGLITPIYFFFITGMAAAYQDLLYSSLKKRLFIALLTIFIGINFQLSQIQFLYTSVIFHIGFFDLCLIIFSFLLKNHRIVKLIIITIIIFSKYELERIYNNIITIRTTWPIIPWITPVLIGYFIGLLYPNYIDYKNQISANKPILRGYIFFLTGMFFYLTFRKYEGVYENINFLYFSLSFILIVYAIFVFIAYIFEHIFELKLISDYSIKIWYIHRLILTTYYYLINKIVDSYQFISIIEFYITLLFFSYINYLIIILINNFSMSKGKNDLRIKRTKKTYTKYFFILILLVSIHLCDFLAFNFDIFWIKINRITLRTGLIFILFNKRDDPVERNRNLIVIN